MIHGNRYHQSSVALLTDCQKSVNSRPLLQPSLCLRWSVAFWDSFEGKRRHNTWAECMYSANKGGLGLLAWSRNRPTQHRHNKAIPSDRQSNKNCMDSNLLKRWNYMTEKQWVLQGVVFSQAITVLAFVPPPPLLSLHHTSKLGMSHRVTCGVMSKEGERREGGKWVGGPVRQHLSI